MIFGNSLKTPLLMEDLRNTKLMVKYCSVALLFFYGIVFVLSCSNEPKEIIQYIKVPTHLNSSEPNLLKTNDGTLYLSWIESDSLSNSRLLFSKLRNDGSWSESKSIAEGNNWFVNWADFPSLSAFGESNLVAHFLDKSAEDTYAYDVKLSISNDHGDHWNTPFIPHNDKTKTEHGFVSKIGLDDDNFLAIWLDGRQYAYAEKDTTLQKQMSLRSAIFDSNGVLIKDGVIDPRVCDCCQTDLAMTSNGPVAIFRDRSDTEVRDIYFSRFIDNSWSTPIPVYDDNWIIPGCPVNGAAIVSNNDLIAASWFSMADNMPEVKLAFLEANAETFSDPINLDYINPLGRVDVEFIDHYSVLVSWMDSTNGITKIQMQKIQKNGQKSEVFTLSEVSDQRASGFPKMVVNDGFVFVTWTEVGDHLQVRSARVNLNEMK